MGIAYGRDISEEEIENAKNMMCSFQDIMEGKKTHICANSLCLTLIDLILSTEREECTDPITLEDIIFFLKFHYGFHKSLREKKDDGIK